jgi:hypothetical protein
MDMECHQYELSQRPIYMIKKIDEHFRAVCNILRVKGCKGDNKIIV